MILNGYENDDVLEFIEQMGDQFNLEEAMEAFIRNDKLDLIYFGEQRPEFIFKIKYFGLSM